MKAPMRKLAQGALAVLLLGTPALAQSATPDKKVQSGASQSQPAPAAKDQKEGASPPARDPAPQASKDDTITNFDVNGSNASDAMGGAP